MAQVELMDTDEEFKLLDFAEEILIEIFSFYDDSTLIKSTKVCRRFKTIAEVAVQDKYNGNCEYYNYYQLKEYPGNANDQRIQHEPFFSTFANQIQAIKISFHNQDCLKDNWMIELILKYCPNMLKLILNYTGKYPPGKDVSDLEQIISRLPQLRFLQLNEINLSNSRWSEYSYPLLTGIYFDNVDILDLPTLQEFLGNNRQLETFKSYGLNHIKFAAFDGSNLRELNHFSDDNSLFFDDSLHVQMKMLKKFSIANCSFDLVEKLAAGCENIETLTISTEMVDPIEIAETQRNALRSFKQMSSLRLLGFRLSADQMKKLIAQSPNLVEFECTWADNISIDDVKDIVLHGNSKLGKIRLECNITNVKPSELDWKFYNWFKSNAKSDLKLVLLLVDIQTCWTYEFIITKEKLTRNGAMMCWNDYEQSTTHFGQSKVEFLQLKDKCFLNIIEYLNQFDKLALYQTCSRMQKLIEPMFQQEYADNSFSLQCNSPLTEHFIRYFGKFMKNITFGSDYRFDNIDDRCELHWELIHKYCNVALVNLTVEHSSISQHISFMDVNKILLPNLRKLKITSPIELVKKATTTTAEYTHLIYSFCPNLEHIEFGNSIVMIDFLNLNIDVWLSNLTTLRIERFTTTWIAFLRALNDNAHRNLSDLTLQYLCDVVNGRPQYQLDNAVVNEIVRFPNLKSLNLFLSGIQNVNTKFLFENCSKLENLSIAITGSYITTYMIYKNITKSCNKLKTLKIVVKRDPSVTGHFSILAKVLRYFLPPIVIKVYEADDDGNFTKGFILDKEWLADYENYRSSIYD